MVELQAFGPIDLRGDGDDLASILTQPKRLALLAFLVLARPRGYQRRDTLLAMFWPGLDQPHGRKALSQSLSFLRHGLPEGVIVTRGGEEVGVDPERVRCDVVLFEQAMEPGDWQEALSLYRGDFLAGFHVTDAPGFQRWLDGERERLREMASRTAWSLAHERIRAGQPLEAERVAQEALRLAPTDESPVRAFIEALSAGGDRAAALRFYEKFAAVLAEELEVAPAPETVAVADLVRNGGGSEPPGTAGGRVAVSTVDGASEMSQPGTAGVYATQAAPPMERAGERGPAGPPARGRWLRLVRIAGTIALGGLALLMLPRSTDRPVPTAPRVAVLPFDIHADDPSLAEFGRVAADWITGGLAAIDNLQVVPSFSVAAALPMPKASNARVEPVDRIARRTGAGLAVTGTITLFGDSLEVRAELVDIAARRVLDSFGPVRAARTEPTRALGLLRRRVTGGVALLLDDRVAGLASVKDPDPPSYEAYRAYLSGIDLFFQARYTEAIRQLDRAWSADTSFMAPGIWVASAFGNMGLPSKQDSVLAFMEPHRARLSSIEQGGLDVMRASLQGDLGAVYRIARSSNLDPTLWSTERRLIAGVYAFDINRPREAVDILGTEPDWGVTRNRFLPFHSAMTGALHVLRDHERELEAAREARSRFPDRIEPVFWHARALIALGRTIEAERVLEEGMTRSSTGWSPGYLQLRAGLELRYHGYHEAGNRALHRGIEWLHEAGSTGANAFSAARGQLSLGRPDSAAQKFRVLAENDPHDVDYAGYLGLALAAAGRVEAARRVDRRLAAWDEPYVRGRHLYWRAAIAARLGRAEEAMALLREALAQGVSYASLHENEDLRPLWGQPAFQRLLEPEG